jgi:F0F1-type ATP synthase epsilon subunit
MAEMEVELVAVERRVWSGKASFVFARTTVGEIGEEIDVARARAARDRADESDPEGAAAAARAQVRLKAAGAE